ncbi:trypsin-like peptidase domain-containing protein [Bosea sp. (in: a-proteobacteria)]|uniref:trypsin-like peptidase domain-containing protein n=1 Tax=Bosea sp. (in: a-proteobacteria) TaxID=1871050 RepID=UPI003FA5C7A1
MMTPENSSQTAQHSPAPARSILKRGALIAGAATLSIGLMAGIADNLLTAHGGANAQPIQLSGVQTQLPSFADVVEKVKPAVVSVRVTSRLANAGEEGESGINSLPPGHPLERFFREFDEQNPRRGHRMPQPERRAMAQGSGFFVSQDGYVVTNNHVVANAAEVQLVTDDGKTLTAKVIGTDPRTDLALLKVNESGNYPFVQLAGAKPRIGDWVVAVGNPFGLGGSVTAGIVSAQGRDIGSGPYDDFIQIDAAVNRGNSGGPTFNLKGEVVGVNTAIFSPSGGNVGIAFAIPTTTVASVVEALKKHGTVARGFIGVQIQPVTAEVADAIGLKDAKGALIAEAQLDGPAAKAGLRRGDTIVAVNGEKIADARALSRKIATFAPGTKTNLTIWRDGKEREVSFEVGRQPAA